MGRLGEADVILICVPTPLSDSRDPDLSYVESTARAISKTLRPGQLILLESLQIVPPFYDHPAYIEACATVARPYVDRPEIEQVFFSFHGLPERSD